MNRMTGTTDFKRLLFCWMAIAVFALIGVAVAGHPVAADHGDGNSDRVDIEEDYTEQKWDSVWWGYGPNAHETGEQSGWAFRSSANDARGGDFDMEYFQYVAIHAPWGDFSDCAVTDTDVAGVDRGDDNWEGEPYDPGNDESLVSDIQDSRIGKHYGYFQFAGPDGFGDRGININHTDSFTAGLSCFNNPEEEGWYRLSVWFNGTDYDGSYNEFLNFNEWKYFCNNADERCSDRQEAIETLGPPPTQFTYPTGERVQNYEPDTPWAHTSGAPNADENEGSGTPTPEPDGDTPTPEPDDDTPTPEPDDDTPTSEPDDDTSASEPDGDTPTPEPNGDDTGGDNDEPTTPTVGDGPGLGVVAALAALLCIALAVMRRG